MSIDLANDLWTELKTFINNPELEDASSILVDLLTDYDFSVDEIAAAFKSDSDVKETIQREYPDVELDFDEPNEDFFFDEEDD